MGSLGNFVTPQQLEKWLMAESNGKRDSKNKQNVLQEWFATTHYLAVVHGSPSLGIYG